MKKSKLSSSRWRFDVPQRTTEEHEGAQSFSSSKQTGECNDYIQYAFMFPSLRYLFPPGWDKTRTQTLTAAVVEVFFYKLTEKNLKTQTNSDVGPSLIVLPMETHAPSLVSLIRRVFHAPSLHVLRRPHRNTWKAQQSLGDCWFPLLLNVWTRPRQAERGSVRARC